MRRVAIVIVATVGLSGCGQAMRDPPWPGLGDPTVGKQVIAHAQCGTCHDIPGVEAATGQVGPSLSGFANRTIIAGVLPNTPENLVRWLRFAQSVKLGDAMPNSGLSEAQAKAVAAYLYRLK